MGDIWNIHDLRLTYSTYATNGRYMECPHSQLMYRTCQHYRRLSEHQEPTKHRPETTYVQLELIFPLLILQPSSKFRKTLIPIWSIRILWFQYYSCIPLQTYWVMTLVVTLSLLIGNGYTSKVYRTSLIYSVGTKKNSKLFLPKRYIPLMTLVRVYISGPTKLNKCVGS